MKNMMKRKAVFSLAKTPTFDPCIDCVVAMICDKNKDMCIDKAKYLRENPIKESSTTIKTKKVKKENIWRNINGIKN